MTQLALFKYDGVKVLPIVGFFFFKTQLYAVAASLSRTLFKSRLFSCSCSKIADKIKNIMRS